MKPSKRYIEDFYGGKGCDYKVREVYPPEPSSSACDLCPKNKLCAACDFDPSKHEACDFEPNNGNNGSNEACDFGPNTLSEDIKSVSKQLHK